jgi:hypothetical protein
LAKKKSLQGAQIHEESLHGRLWSALRLTIIAAGFPARICV